MIVLTVEQAERFWSFVQKTETCWLWTGGKLHYGHGAFRVGQRAAVKAHRIAYELCVGPIPDGMNVNHHCDTPACVNPAHLYAGTQTENVRDRTVRGRANNVVAARNAAKTHCKQGHAYTPENTARGTTGKGPKRVCRICAKAAMARWKARNPGKHY